MVTQNVHPHSVPGNLTREEEVALFTRWHGGDEAAMATIVERNVGFAYQVATEYARINPSWDAEELRAAAMRGVFCAALRFDETKGFKFITYAVWWIGHHIDLIIHEDCTIPTPLHCRKPVKCVSISSPLSSSRAGSRTLEEVLASDWPTPEESALEGERRSSAVELVELGLRHLPERSRKVLSERFGIDEPEAKTLAEIGDSMGVTRERVRQIEARGKVEMREALTRYESFYNEVVRR
jgi:RNA polymerase primary sigma factor